jgi:hypothetical protein
MLIVPGLLRLAGHLIELALQLRQLLVRVVLPIIIPHVIPPAIAFLAL